MSVLILAGDSIMYGSWDPEGGWPGKLRNYLDTKTLAESTPLELNTNKYVALYNLGIPGDTSRGLLKRFTSEVLPRINPEQRTIILIAIGTNDAQFDFDDNQFEVPINETEKNITELIAQSRKFSSDIVVVGLPPVDEAKTAPLYWVEGTHYTNENISKYNQLIKNIAEKEKVGFIDINNNLEVHDVSILMEDGIHPSRFGHKVMFEEIRDYLLENKLI